MTEDPFIEHYLVGGPANDTIIYSVMPLPEEIAMLKSPSSDGWVRVTADWPEAIAYDLDEEATTERRRIYRPMNFERDWTIAPGATLKELADERGVSEGEMSRRLGLSITDYRKLLLGDLPITEQLAERISSVLVGATAKFWMDYDKSYRDDLAAGKKDVREG